MEVEGEERAASRGLSEGNSLREKCFARAFPCAGPRIREAAFTLAVLRPCPPAGRVGDTVLSSPCGCELPGDLVPPLGGCALEVVTVLEEPVTLGTPRGSQRALCRSVGQGHILNNL